MMASFRLASLRHYREFLDHLGYISTFIDVVRFNLDAELGVNNSYSIDLFEHRLAQIIQVNFLNMIVNFVHDTLCNYWKPLFGKSLSTFLEKFQGEGKVFCFSNIYIAIISGK